ncbi:hypothetical protein BGZ91_006386, partial [Linnemannia elongata]
MSTLAMTFENPSSTRLTLPADFETPHHHPHHPARPRSTRAPSVSSEKQELDGTLSNATHSNITHVDEDDYVEYDGKSVKNGGSGSKVEGSVITHKAEENLEDGVLDNTDNASIINGRIVDYPEGGFGWLVVLASFIVNFWAFAPNITFGVYQAYFLQA